MNLWQADVFGRLFDPRHAFDHTTIHLSPLERWQAYNRECGLTSSVARAAWWTMVKTTLAVMHRLEICGREHLPKTPNFVLVANHASHLDAIVLGSILPLNLRNCLFPLAAGDVFFEVPAMAAFSAAFLNALPVWRKHAGGARAIKELRQRLIDEPTIYVLFPEGTRSRDGQMQAFKAGIGMLIAETPCPVIPCYLQGTFAALPPGARFPRPRKIRVEIGQPRMFHQSTNRKKQWEEIAAMLEADIRQLATRTITEKR